MRAHWLDEAGAAVADADVDTLRAHGVHYQALDPAAAQPALDSLRSERGYVEQDEIALRPDTPGLDEICAKFDREHYHDEDEVRFVLEGEGVFDIRPADEGAAGAAGQWLRVVVETGDLIVVPARRHHRFELTGARNIQCVRLFKDRSGWVPHYRRASGR